MKNVILLLIVFLLSGCDSHEKKTDEIITDETSKISSLPANTIESMELLKIFALDKSVDYNMYNWQTGADTSSPIIWMDNGIVEATENNDYPYERKGEVYVLNQGKITHTVLEKNTVNGKWQITLRGARGGFRIVNIDSGIFTEPAPQLYLDKKNIIEEKHCEESSSSNTSMYLIGFEDKKPFWLKEEFSSGSAGSSYWYSIMYDKKPECDESLRITNTEDGF